MRLLIITALAALSLPALAENTLTDRDRAMIAQQQQMRQAVLDRARARCIVNRGTDCDSEDGLREWVLLDRSREAAVLDQISPLPALPAGGNLSSGSGATTPATTR